jgi:RNA polymerase primary sigma factor
MVTKAANAKAATPAEPAKAPKGRTKKADAPVKEKKPARVGVTTAEAAEILSERTGRDITSVALRRILRSDDGGFNDKGYTRYDLTPEAIDHLAELIQAGGDGTRRRGRKAKQAEEAEAPEELDALDELDEETTDEDIEELDEEDEEEGEELEEEEDEEELLDEDEE